MLGVLGGGQEGQDVQRSCMLVKAELLSGLHARSYCTLDTAIATPIVSQMIHMLLLQLLPYLCSYNCCNPWLHTR